MNGKDKKEGRAPAGLLLALSISILGLLLTVPAAAAWAQEIDLVVVVDESGSICNGGNVAVEVDGFINAFNEVIVPFVEAGGTVRMAVVSFSSIVVTRIGLVDVATNRSAIVDAFNAIKANPQCGSTNMTAAIDRAISILAGGTAPRKVINLATDGLPDAPAFAQAACTAAKEAGYELWTLGIGDAEEFLNACAGPPPARNFQIASIDDFAEAEREKLGEIIPASPSGYPGGDCPGGGITVDFKEELLGAARYLKRDLSDFREDLRTELEGEYGEGPAGGKLCRLWGTKYWIIDAEKELDYYLDHLDAPDAEGLIRKLQSAQRCKQVASDGLTSIISEKGELESSVEDLIKLIQNNIPGKIGQTEAEHLVNDLLLPIHAALSQKDEELIQIDIKLEKVDEYLIEAEASLQAILDAGLAGDDAEDAAEQAKRAVERAWKEIERAIKLIWELKENLKWVRSYLCGFVHEVVVAPIMRPKERERCPWCELPEGAAGLTAIELRIHNYRGAIRFAALDPGIDSIRVRIFNLAGRAIFDSGLVRGTTFDWHLLDSSGEPVANGVYLYLVEVRTPSGVTRSGVRKLALLRGGRAARS